MDQILITRASGVVELINKTETLTVVTSAEHRKALLGEDVVVMVVESAIDRGFGVGDSIKLFGGNTYRINQLPKITKISNRKFSYELVFEGIQYDLLRASYRNEDLSNFNTSSDFVLIGDIQMFLDLIINNANRVFGANKWVLGTFPSGTETKNLLFNNENCLSVLQRICTEYDYQFVFTETSTQKILHVKKTGTALDFNFQYGKAKGLYQLSREKVESKNIVNKLFVYGSTKNIPSNYKNYSQRLRLGNAEDETVLVASDSLNAFGVFEGTQIFEDIFPQRLGTISGINTSNRYEFTDSSMNFDLNEVDSNGNTKWLIEGSIAKIHFNTGNLAGYEFEISKYVHATKTFTINPIIDPKGINMPSLTESAFYISVSDKYVLLDIVMPDSYITTAEVELEAKATEYLNQYKVPQVQYGLDIDNVFLQNKTQNMNIFELCDTVNIEDTDLGINNRIKIISFTRDVLRPFNYKLTISDVSDTSVLRGLINDTSTIKKVIERKGILDPTENKDTSKVISVTKGVLTNKNGTELGNKAYDSLVKVLGRLGIADNIFYDNSKANDDGTIARRVGLDTEELMIEGDLEMAGSVSVGQNYINLNKKVNEEGISFAYIDALYSPLFIESEKTSIIGTLGVSRIEGIGESGIIADADWAFLKPLTIAPPTADNHAISKIYFEEAIELYEFGEFGQHQERYGINDIYEAPFGASFIAGFITNLPNGVYQGHVLKLSTGKEVLDEATYIGFGMPNSTSFDGNIYLRGVYASGDTGWKKVACPQRFLYEEGEIEIDITGLYYEKEVGDTYGFFGIDNVNGGFVTQLKVVNLENDIITNYRTLMSGEDGRLYFQKGSDEMIPYVLAGEVVSGGNNNYTFTSPLYVNPDLPTHVNIEIASATKTGVLTSTDWTTFNDKLSDGDTVNDSLKFANSKAMYWGYTSVSVYAARLYYNLANTSLNLQAEDTNIYISTDGTDKNIEIKSFDADILLYGNKYYLHKKNTSQNIEIDMSNFADGKVLKGTSSTKAEWVTP